MNPCADFRYRLEEAVLEETAHAGLISALVENAKTGEQARILEAVLESDQAHALIFASLMSASPMSVCHPIAVPKADAEFSRLLESVIAQKLRAYRRLSVLAECAPTQMIRYTILAVMQDELNHTRILNSLMEADSIE